VDANSVDLDEEVEDLVGDQEVDDKYPEVAPEFDPDLLGVLVEALLEQLPDQRHQRRQPHLRREEDEPAQMVDERVVLPFPVDRQARGLAGVEVVLVYQDRLVQHEKGSSRRNTRM
jgi:hypothetical protein